MSEGLVDIGVTDAACAHLHQHLTGPGLRLRNILDLPRTALGGYDGGFHRASSWDDSMRAPLGWVHDFTPATDNGCSVEAKGRSPLICHFRAWERARMTQILPRHVQLRQARVEARPRADGGREWRPWDPRRWE